MSTDIKSPDDSGSVASHCYAEPRWVPTECDGPLLTMPPLELAKLWGELVEAYHGKNGFGGDTAELYSYRFQRMNPQLHAAKIDDEDRRDEIEWEHYFAAGRALLSLLQQFCMDHQCSTTIDGIEAEEWAESIACDNHRFDHRAHVKIVHVSA